MGSFKKLKSSDVITVPVIANKSWNFNYCPVPVDDPYITIYNGTNLTGSFTPGGEAITNGHYDRLTYAQINQLFYHQYSGSLSTASLASSLYYESASGLRPTASYFNFNNDPAFISYFPTASNANIKVIYISPSIYGQRILPYSLQMSSSTYNLRDDGKGNVYDSTTHVGNIFYPEGVIVITNTDYQSIFPLPPVAYDDTVNIVRSNYGNSVTISISPLTNDDLRGNTLVNQSITLSNSTGDFFSTGSSNTVSMSFSGLGIGTYTTDYSFLVTGSYCGNLRSNTATITVNVTDPDCEFEMGIALGAPVVSLTPTPSATPSVSVTPSATPSVSITPSITLSTSITPSITPSVSISNTPSVSITPSITITPSASPSISISPSVTSTPSISATPSISVTPSISITPSVTPSVTPSTSVAIYTYLRYDVDVPTCGTSNPQPFYSFTNYSNGYYYINGDLGTYYYISDSVHTSYINQITSVSATTCTPVSPTPSLTPTISVTPSTSTPVYYYVVYDIDAFCNAIGGSQVYYKATTNYDALANTYVKVNGLGDTKYFQIDGSQTGTTIAAFVSATCTPVSPTPSISISNTPSVSITPTISISSTPSVSVTPSISISNTPSVSVTPSISISNTPSTSVTPSISISNTPSTSVTPSISISRTPSVSVTPSISISSTPSVSVTPSISISSTPSISVTPSISISRTPSISVTPSVTPSTSLPLYTYLRYDVDTATCGTSNPQPFYSLNNYSAGYYYINGNFSAYYYISSNVHTNYTNQITSVSATSCTPISPTPSTTPSVSVTPSISISRTPSVSISNTPSVSVTPSPAPALTGFTISDTNYGSDTEACGATSYTTAYSNGSTSPPVFGDIIYANAGGTVLLNSGYYLVPDSFPSPAWIRLDGSSQVIENGLCP